MLLLLNVHDVVASGFGLPDVVLPGVLLLMLFFLILLLNMMVLLCS